MRSRAAWAGKSIVIAVLVAAPFAIHLAIISGKWINIILMMPFLQLVILGIALLGRPAGRRKWILASAAVLVLAPLYAEAARLNAAGVSGIPHAFAYSVLLVGFGASLLPGHEPVLTRLVLRIRGTLPPALVAYTRRVTWAWCIFFAAQLVVSVALFSWAPITLWSLFVNVLNLPLVVLMFGVEYGYRVVRFRAYRHDNISDIMRLLGEARKSAPRQADST